MKIGILTFHCAYNFGAVLQCYALYSTIKLELGHDVEVIDYRPQYLSSKRAQFNWRTFINRRPWKLTERIAAVKKARCHYDKFKEFSDVNLSLSPICKCEGELQDICNRYDCVVVGSDQVWCRKYNGNDGSWFGLDTTKELKWVGYAVSAGHTRYDSTTLRTLTRRFEAIGARELSLYNILNSCFKGNISHVLDPTLLAPYSLWEKWCSPVLDEPYILTYQGRETDYTFELANSIAKQLGVKKVVPVDFYSNVKGNGFQTHVCSPDEFVALVKNASCVVTTSFHGTAFSVILGTPFYTIRLNDGADGRAQDLLDSINLSDRMVDVNSEVEFGKYDSVAVHDSLNRLKEHSLNFLKITLR